MPEEDSVGSTTTKDQAILVVPMCDESVIQVKAYCQRLLPNFCGKHITDGGDNKEVIVLIDLKNVQGIPQFVNDLHRVLGNYDVTIYTGLDYQKCQVTCLVLHVYAK